MKRCFSLLLALIFIMGCASCSILRDEPSETVVDVPVSTDNGEIYATSVPTEQPTDPASDTPTQSPWGAPTDAPSEEPTEQPSDTPSAPPSEAPTETPSPAPEITAAPASTPTPRPTNTPSPAPTFTPAPKPTDAPTAAPKPTNTPTPRPTDTPKPDPTATPKPADGSGITFSENPSLPLPSTNEDVPQGQPFCFGGIVKSSRPITSVTAEITTTSGTVVISRSVDFDASDNKTSVELVDRTFPSSGNNSLTAKVKFQELSVGVYYFNLYAAAEGVSPVLLRSSKFRIVDSSGWIKLISNNLRNSYAFALQFFGSRDDFMFEYKWKASTGRDIELKGGKEAWASKHMTTVENPSGGKWQVHKKAAEGYTRAVNYMKTTYLRVHGTNGDTGVIKLSALITSFDGTWNPRFVSDRSFVSHHAFGAAIDLNASMDANRNNLSNRTLIKNEVKDHLEYNGIKTASDGAKYFDFTYNGSHATDKNGVPTTVVNYLLYELAFYRAGFNWGYYYDHTCDAMHFGLSEMSADIHNTSNRSLRKVYSYS